MPRVTLLAAALTTAMVAAPAAGRAAPLTAADQLRVVAVDGRPTLVDGRARPVLLRGVAVNALVDYGAPGAVVPFDPAVDPRQIAALGLNGVRLAVSWSRVMPEPGRLDAEYLTRISEAVGSLSASGVHTVVSMHSDRYAAGLGTAGEFDGAPRWAVDTGGRPCGTPDPGAYYTPCAAYAAGRFYAGGIVQGRSLVDWYADAAAAVSTAARRGGPGYSGLDVVNEPHDPAAAVGAGPTATWQRRLEAVYDAVATRMRASGDAAPLWVQPYGSRSTRLDGVTPLPSLGAAARSRGVVYAPHAYVDVYDRQPDQETPARIDAQHDAFRDEADRLSAVVVVGEFPGASGGVWDVMRMLHLRSQERIGAGGLSWLWKQPSSGYGWGLLSPDGALRPGTDGAVSLSRARIVAGTGLRASSDGYPGAPVSVQWTAGAERTADVWLGTHAATLGWSPRIAAGGGASIVGASRSTARLGLVDVGGWRVTLRIPAGTSGAVTLTPGS